MAALLAFLGLSVPAVLLSLPYLANPRAHGFFRLFAFESVLALVLLNLESWFRQPLAPLHLVSWALLAASLIVVVHGFWLLRRRGRPQRGIETTTVLVGSGAYRYIRHPLYASLLFLGWGAFLKAPSWLTAALTGFATATIYLTAATEERESRLKFGPAYDEYQRRTRMFIPYLF